MIEAYTIDRGDGPEPLAFGPFVDEHGTQHSVQTLELWTDEDLAIIGVSRVTPSIGALAQDVVEAVNAERDRRIDGGFMFAGHPFQSAQSDRENILGLGVQAQLAIAAGAKPDDLLWLSHDPDKPFAWILTDNSTLPLDAFGMLALYSAGVAFKSDITLAGRAKKDWLLDPARTREEVTAFDLTADWPT